MSSQDLLSDVAPGRPLTGWKILAIAVGCFGVVFAVNGLMAYYAISTFRGEVEASPYEHGLAYEKDILAAQAQGALGWNVSEHLARDSDGEATLEVRVVDRSGTPVTGLGVTTGFDSPADKRFDADLTLNETDPGVYLGRLSANPGQWDVILEAKRDGERVFKSKNRIALR